MDLPFNAGPGLQLRGYRALPVTPQRYTRKLDAKMTVQYDSNGFPKTLLDWRREPRNECFTVRYESASLFRMLVEGNTWLILQVQMLFLSSDRHLWYPLETFFSSKGYTFFVSNSKYEGCHTTAVEGEERAPDEFHYVLPEDLRGDRCQYIHHVWPHFLVRLHDFRLTIHSAT